MKVLYNILGVCTHIVVTGCDRFGHFESAAVFVQVFDFLQTLQEMIVLVILWEISLTKTTSMLGSSG